MKVRGLRFEWDDRKATANRRKHGVSFEEARTVFLDESALLRPDEDHSGDEDRFVLLGLSVQMGHSSCVIVTGRMTMSSA